MPDGMPLTNSGFFTWAGDAAALARLDPTTLLLSDHRSVAWWTLVTGLLSRAATPSWHVVLGYRLLRLGQRIDAVLVSDRAVLALLVMGEGRAGCRVAVENMALDLADFHAGCRGLPVLPVLVLPGGRAEGSWPLPLAGAAPVIETTRALLPGLLQEVITRFPTCTADPAAWVHASYHPVPGLMEAACLLYRQHDVMALRLAQTGKGSLARTSAAVRNAVMTAQVARERLVIFVTGAPGAGKTLLGLDVAFTSSLGGAAFLTGNPTLVHVLREALARDAALHGLNIRAAQQRMQGVIQPLPGFRDHYLTHGIPPEAIVVIDEAQRCWTKTHAVSKTQNRAIRLADSEPGHLLDSLSRRPEGAVVICLLGGGQEIHAGEGGVAAWGDAVRSRPEWRVLAPPGLEHAADPRQRLRADVRFERVADLALGEPVRAIHHGTAAAWVDAVLANDPAAARAIADTHSGKPFRITRSLEALRRALRPRGERRAGLVASSGARRLRAEGLGSVLDHQDEDAVARWFLDRWPDCRASDALETVATEFSVQGLELDHVGLCWDADLLHRNGWIARHFRGAAWTALHRTDAMSNRLNAYRVLLTRARHGTIIWMPRGDARDPTRDPAGYDHTAEFLLSCGAVQLDVEVTGPDNIAMTPARLL